MQRIREMVQTHPNRPQEDGDALADAIVACCECVSACLACADACLHEDDPKKLAFCIRTDTDCADIAAATGRVLSRASKPDAKTVAALLEACATACHACAAECRQHAGMHEHCRVCAEACALCEEQCQRLLAATPA